MRHLVTFCVVGLECVPWKVPTIGNRTKGDGTRYRFTTRKEPNDPASGRLGLACWQRYIKDASKSAMEKSGYTKPLTDQLRVDYTFFCRTPEGSRDGQVWPIDLVWDKKKKLPDGKVGGWKKRHRNGRLDPDTTNLMKAAEDGMHGSVFVDDCQCRGGSWIALYGPQPGVRITVSVIEPGDYPGTGETRE